MKNYRNFFIIISFFFFLFSFFLSCERVNPPVTTGGLEKIQLTDLDHIPLEFGQLIAATSPQFGVANLWFQDDSETIRMLQINLERGRMTRIGWVFRRK